MRFIKLFVLFFFLSTPLYSLSTTEQEQKQIGLVAHIIKNSTTENMKEVWPNFDLSKKPLIITYENGHIFAFNLKSTDKAWRPLNFQGTKVLYAEKDYWGLTAAPMQFDFEIEGQKAFVFRFNQDNETPFSPFFVMVHERFHVYQIQEFLSERNIPKIVYNESQNPENIALMQLEELVLLDFLKALRNGQDKEIKEQLKTYISINKERRKVLKADDLLWESRQQMVEGLADYVTAKNLDVFSYFGDKVGITHLLNTMHGYTQDESITERALKWRHYGVGSSLGFALDYLKVKDWKEQVEKSVYLQEILEKNLKTTSNEEAFLVEKAKNRYQFEKLKEQVTKKINAYVAMIQRHKKNFEEKPGIIISLQAPLKTGLSAGGRSRGVYSLADGSMLSVDDTSKTSSPDNRWYLELTAIPELFHVKNFRHFKEDRNSVSLTVDGELIDMADLEVKEFKSLQLEGKSCHFKSDFPGKVEFKNNELIISYSKENS